MLKLDIHGQPTELRDFLLSLYQIPFQFTLEEERIKDTGEVSVTCHLQPISNGKVHQVKLSTKEGPDIQLDLFDLRQYQMDSHIQLVIGKSYDL